MPKVFIAGCGFLGLSTARRLHGLGFEVVAGTHSPDSAAALVSEPFPVIACDIADPAALRSQTALQQLDVVIHCASSGRGDADAYRCIYLNGVRNLAAAFASAKLIFTSSTSVYAQTDGAWVTEESPAEPMRETGRILRETEDVVLANRGIVARLAGLYGPGRSVLLQRFFSGDAIIEGDGNRLVNQVHRDDAAAALCTLIKSDLPGVFNVADDEPMTQRATYEWLSQRFDRPLPAFGAIDLNRKRGWTSKRVSNAKLRQLGWTPQFPSFREAVERDRLLIAAFIT